MHVLIYAKKGNGNTTDIINMAQVMRVELDGERLIFHGSDPNAVIKLTFDGPEKASLAMEKIEDAIRYQENMVEMHDC